MNWARFLQRDFILAAALLLVTALGMRFAIAQLNFFLKKERIDLAKPLDAIPDRIGPYEVVRRDDRMSSAEEAALGTTQYISFVVHDTRKTKPDPENGVAGDKFSLFRFHVAYYTGTPDTVPHVPERCFVGAGADATESGSTMLTLTRDNFTRRSDGQVVAITQGKQRVVLPELKAGDQLPAKLFTYRRGPNAPLGYVTYFFVANNEIKGNAELVRKYFMTNIRDRYAYYAKVECNPLTGHAATEEETVAAMSELMSYMFPEVVACLPDWEAATSKPENHASKDAEAQANSTDPS